MDIPKTLNEIIDRHEARIAACGDKLMNAERDMDVLLHLLEEYFAPIILAARELHENRDSTEIPDVRERHIMALTKLSVMLRLTGVVK